MDFNKDFWYDSYRPNPTLTDEMIAQAEAELELKLPTSFLELLKIHNGGETRGLIFPINKKTSWSDNHVPFDELFGIFLPAEASEEVPTETDEEAPVETSEFNLLISDKLSKEWGLPEKQIILNGDGNCCITLDYRQDEQNPIITWIDTEMKEDIELAPNFEAFINGLVPFEQFKG